jgi:hypothetical protein
MDEEMKALLGLEQERFALKIKALATRRGLEAERLRIMAEYGDQEVRIIEESIERRAQVLMSGRPLNGHKAKGHLVKNRRTWRARILPGTRRKK